jgi:hypothetical protein
MPFVNITPLDDRNNDKGLGLEAELETLLMTLWQFGVLRKSA